VIVTKTTVRQAVIRAIPRPARNIIREQVVRRRHADLGPADLLLASYPKSGNTWARFVLTHAFLNQEVDFDSVRQHSPYLGMHRRAAGILPGGGRLIKTHESYRDYASRCPAVYLIRDGRDVCVSYYFMMKRLYVHRGTFEEFLERFLAGDIEAYGAWQDHVASWERAQRQRPGEVAFVRYEDMLTDAATALATAFKEIGRPLDVTALRRAVNANSAHSMRAKEASSAFLTRHRVDHSISVVRSGTSGSWRDTFDAAAAERFRSVAGQALRAAGYED
jgi:hypothetical protein